LCFLLQERKGVFNEKNGRRIAKSDPILEGNKKGALEIIGRGGPPVKRRFKRGKKVFRSGGGTQVSMS